MRTNRRAMVIAFMAATLSTAGVAMAAGFDLIAVTTTVDGTTGDWAPGRSTTQEPTPAAATTTPTTPSATPSAEPVIPATPATTATPTSSSTSTEVAPTTEP